MITSRPAPEWKGQDAFLIGGGSSLQHFNWGSLVGKNTIGCNDAYRLGSEVVKFGLFGDASFFHKFKWDMEKFGNPVFSCAPAIMGMKASWLRPLERTKEGLNMDGGLAWNHSTGAAAVNLAILLGANRIFLLGYDMGKRADGRSHWHSHREKKIQDDAYLRFLRGFQTLHNSLLRYPEIKVVNVTDGSSKLPLFERMSFAELEGVLHPAENWHEHHPTNAETESCLVGASGA